MTGASTGSSPELVPVAAQTQCFHTVPNLLLQHNSLLSPCPKVMLQHNSCFHAVTKFVLQHNMALPEWSNLPVAAQQIACTLRSTMAGLQCLDRSQGCICLQMTCWGPMRYPSREGSVQAGSCQFSCPPTGQSFPQAFQRERLPSL